MFYDKYEQIELWGKDLYDHLHKVYSVHSRYTVMFISAHYKEKLWTNHERKSAQERAFREFKEYILPARFDNTEIPGIMSTIGYVDISDLSPRDFALMISKKIGPVHKKNFFPDLPDLLFRKMKAKSNKRKGEVFNVARNFFQYYILLTPDERLVLFHLINNACAAGVPSNFHASIDLLSRISGRSQGEVVSLLSGLKSLFICVVDDDEDKHGCDDEDVPTIKIEILDPTGKFGNITSYVYNMFQCLSETLCENCYISACIQADFSNLSSLTCRNETT